MRRLIFIGGIVLALFAGACVPHSAPSGRPLVAAGSALLQLYLQPLPPEAGGLLAEVSSVSLVASDGSSHPLPIASAVIGGTVSRQRLLAAGPVPPGEYVAVEIGFASTRLVSGTELRTPDGPIRVDLALSVRPDEASIVTLQMAQESPVIGEGVFDPTFTAGSPRSTELATGATAIATLPRAAAISIFSKITGEVFGVFRTAELPLAAVYNAVDRRVYVACARADVIEVFDLELNAREQSFPLTLGDRPSAIAVSRDSNTVVVANAGSNTVSVLDGPILAERFRVVVGQEPWAVLLGPDEARAFVFLYDSNSVAVVDLTRGVVLSNISTDGGPVYGAFDRERRNLLVIHRDSPYIDVVDTSALRVVRRINVGTPSQAIAVGPRTGRVYLAQPGALRIEVYDPSALLPVDAIEVGEDVSFLTIDDETAQLLAIVPESGQVRILRVEGGAPVGVAEFGEGPSWVDVAGTVELSR